MRTATAALLLLAAPAFAAPPATPVRGATDTYHGVQVKDPYRWLEDWSDPEVKAWSEAQNEYARAYLDKLPHRDEIRARLTELLSAPVTSWGSLNEAGGKLFAIINQPPKQQPFLAVMDSPDAPQTARTLVDPETFDKDGAYAIDWYEPSPDGKLVAVSMSKGGSESGDLFIFDVATGKRTGEVIERVNGGTAGGSLAWAPDSKSFYYTRYPRGGERPESDMYFYVDVYRHDLGTAPIEDAYEIGHDFPRIGEIELKTDQASGRVIATVQDGDGGEFSHFVRQPSGEWDLICGFKEGVTQAYFGAKGEIYLISNADAPRGKVLRVHAANPALQNATPVIDQSKDTIISNFWGPHSLIATDDRLFVQYQTGGPSTIRMFDLQGQPLGGPDLPPVSAVGQMLEADGGVLYSAGSYTTLSSWYRFDPDSSKTSPTALRSDPPADLSNVRVVREYALSKDGTRIPINIMIPPGVKRDGSNPCILNSYGGYGISLSPSYRASRADLLEQGVIYAVANIRGGGEYGEEWHRGGNLTNKQNVFDDFQAAGEYLTRVNYTNPQKLVILGGSNGGLLMGATLTQRPDLARTVVSYVGIYDMLRVELSPNGAFNIPEFGTVKDADQFKAMYAYSPYHNVKPGVDYPAVLFLTGANDPRVDPMQSRKMTAMLQANAEGNPLHEMQIEAQFNNSLEDILTFVTNISNMRIDVDWSSLGEVGIRRETSIYYQSNEKKPLDEILTDVLEKARADTLGWAYVYDMIVVAPKMEVPVNRPPAPNPILLRTSMNTGHGIGTPLDEQIEEAVDVHSFLYGRLGVEYQPVKK
ncbi:MAG: S9 family peptidase [Phycisphaeraceae bacterium]|nr:MAG: S9 family peptidase [Phycisphaeraceae bacterium]